MEELERLARYRDQCYQWLMAELAIEVEKVDKWWWLESYRNKN